MTTNQTIEQTNQTIKQTIEQTIEQTNENEDEYVEQQVKYVTLCSNVAFESLKRAFINHQNDEFITMINSKYTLHKAGYKYWDDFTTRPDYVARNLNKGFIQIFGDYRKYFFTCFRCIEIVPKTYTFESYWIVNTSDYQKIIQNKFDDYDWIEMTPEEFIQQFMNKENDAIISEDYLH